MTTKVIYEIARYAEDDGSSTLLSESQLVAIGQRILLLRGFNAEDEPCDINDPGAVISSTPSLREIRAGEVTRITCEPELAARLPLLLEPHGGGGDIEEFFAEVNGKPWAAFNALDGDFVMLPGYPDEPDFSPWAEQGVSFGEWNPLQGWTSIGLATPLVLVEYANYDHGGFGGGSAVAVSAFDDFPSAFVDWLKNWTVLESLWEGDSLPYLPSVELFGEATARADRSAQWSSWTLDMGEDDPVDEEPADDADEDEDGNEDDSGSEEASAYLNLYLSDEQVAEVRAYLDSRD